MSAITANFSVTFDVLNKKFIIVDTTDYAGQGETPGDWDGVIKITSPASIVIYNNTNFLSPDIDRAVTDTNNAISIPVDSTTNEPLKGNYEITYTISDGVSTCPITKTFNFQYESPEISIEASFDCVTPLIVSEDKTNYLVNGQSPTTTVRSHTLFYPDTTGEADLTGDVAKIQTSTMYVLDNGQALQYEINLTSTLTYNYPAAGSSSAFTVTDEISGDEFLDVICDPNLCSVYCGIKKQYDLYLETKSTQEGAKAKSKLVLMTGIAELARIAFECNRPSDVTALLNEIKKIGGFEDDCACGTGEIVLYKGLGIIDPGVVVAEGSGIDVAAVTVGDTTTYTVSIEAATLDIINNFEKSAPVDGVQINVTDNGLNPSGVREFQIDIQLGLTAGNIPMVKAGGDELEDSPLSYDGTTLATSLAVGKVISLAAGAGALTVDNTQAKLTKDALTVGIIDDGGTDTSALISGSSSVKVISTGITALIGDQSTKWNDSDGILSEEVNGADTIKHQLVGGIATQSAVNHKFEILTPNESYTPADEFRLFSASGDIFTAKLDGTFELGLAATSDNVNSIAIGASAVAQDVPGNIAIGKSAVATNQTEVSGNCQIAIGNTATTSKLGQISIGQDAGNDAGTIGINAISIGTFSNFSGASNGIGEGSIALGTTTQNFSAAVKSISIGNNIENNLAGAIVLGYSNSPTALSPVYADSFNLGFNVTTPQVVFSGTESYYNLSAIMFGDTIAAPSQVSVKGDVEVTDVGNGYILKSPDTARWKLEVDNLGAVSASLA